MAKKGLQKEPANVLIVDDRPENLDALEAALSGLNLRLTRARCGEDALRQILEQVFAVVLLDVQMPGMDGFETASLIRKRERTRRLPIIFITAADHPGGQMARAYTEGAVDFLFKPLDPDVLRAKVSVFVDLFEQARELEREVARRKRAESQLEKRVRERTRELAQSDERYRAFIANSSEAIWRFELERPVSIDLPVDDQIDRFFRYAYLAEANDVMARMYGLERVSSLIGCRLGDILVREDPNNIEYLRAFIRSGYRLTDVESHERDREGRSKYFLNNFAGVVENGFVLRAWGTQRDVTQQRQWDAALRLSEERMRLILDTALDAVITMDSSGNVMGWNRQAEAIFGYSAGETEGKALADLIIPPELRERHWRGLEHYKETGEGAVLNRRIEIDAVRRDGTRFPVELAITPIPVEDAISFSGFVRDISARKQAEAELQASNERLKWAMTETHHRVKNNLQTIAAMVDMRLMEHVEAVPAEEMRRFAAYVQTLAAVHNVLTQQAKVDATAESLSARAALEHLIPLLREGAPDVDLELNTVDARLPLRQGTALCIVANELVHNAARVSKRIRVAFRVEGDFGVFEVSDDGPGFRDQDRHGPSKTGLNLVENVSRWDLGGSVTFEDSPAGGARVLIRFPLTAPPLETPAETVARKRKRRRIGSVIPK